MVTLGDRSPAGAALKPAHSTGGGGGAAPVAAAVDGEPLGRSGLLDRTQYIRLLEQALSSLGYTDVASQLERASGITAQPPQVTQLQAAVLAGDWAAAAKHLSRLDLRSQHALQEAHFLIQEQAYLEALQAGDTASALACLRQRLAPLSLHSERLHQLAACLMGGAAGAAAAAQLVGGGWQDGPPSQGPRHAVLRRLQAAIPPHLMLPERRLEELVEQALAAQIAGCRFHNTPAPRPSLLSDYTAGVEQIPSCTAQVLLDHTDEVWHLQFSHDGEMLASCGKDQTAIIWDVRRRRNDSSSAAGGSGAGSFGSPGSSCRGHSGSSPGGGSGASPGAGPGSGGGSGGGAVARRHVLQGHTGPIAFLCWSPDDRKLATCGQDALRLWDAATGKCLAVFLHHKEPVTCAAWFPDGQRLVTGSHDKQLCIVTLDGSVERSWRIQRIQEVLVAKGGRYVLATTCERKVRVYDLQTDTETYIPEAEPLISISLSRDGRHLLVNLTSNCMHLWDCGDAPDELRMPAMPCATYQGATDKQSRFVVRSCLGGLDDRFVLSGSEECCVYVYHRQTGERLLCLEGHSGTVNSVAWNPADPQMFASASDDKSIHIWQTAAAVQRGGVSSPNGGGEPLLTQ